MNLTNFLVRLTLVVYLSITAYETLKNIDSSSETLSQSYKTFQQTFQTRTNLNFHERLSHQSVSKHAKCATQGLAYAILGLGAATLLICQGFAILLGFVYLIQQMVLMNFAKFDMLSSLEEFHQLSLCLFIVLVCFMVAQCGSGKGSCPIKCRSDNNNVENVKVSGNNNQKRGGRNNRN